MPPTIFRFALASAWILSVGLASAQDGGPAPRDPVENFGAALPDELTLTARIGDSSFTRLPELSAMNLQSMQWLAELLKRAPIPYPGDVPKPRENTPWQADAWAEEMTRDILRNPAKQRELGSSLYAPTRNLEMFARAANAFSNASYFIVSPSVMDRTSTTAAYLPNNVLWPLLRSGDLLLFETGPASYHIVQLFNKDKDEALLLDRWPRRFIFKDAHLEKDKNGVPFVRVGKDELLGNLRQAVILETVTFPHRLVTALQRAGTPLPPTSVHDFARQLLKNPSLFEIELAWQILVKNEPLLDGAEEDIRTEQKALLAYSHLLRGAAITSARMRGDFGAPITPDPYASRIKVSADYVAAIGPVAIKKLLDDRQWAEVGARYLHVDLNQSGSAFASALELNQENIDALLGFSLVSVYVKGPVDALDKLSVAKKLVARRDQLNREDQTALEKVFANAGLKAGDYPQVRNIRPDIRFERTRIEKWQNTIKEIEDVINSPATKLRHSFPNSLN